MSSRTESRSPRVNLNRSRSCNNSTPFYGVEMATTPSTKPFAVTKRKEIMDSAKTLKIIGDELNAKYTRLSERHELDDTDGVVWSIGNCLRYVVDSTDAALEWLEQTGHKVMNNIDKQEGLLRGLLRMIDLGDHLSSVAIMEISCRYLAEPEVPYKTDRDFVHQCLQGIERQVNKITEKVKEANTLLKEIIQSDDYNIMKAKLFDNVVKEAHLAIEICQQNLDAADTVIKKLVKKIDAVRWFTRGLRLAALGTCAYYLYKKVNDETISFPAGVAGTCLAGVMFLCIFPAQTYELYDSLKKLEYKHLGLQGNLRELEQDLERMEITKQEVEPVTE